MNDVFIGEHSTIMINMDNVETIKTDGTPKSWFDVQFVSGHSITLDGQNAALFRAFLARPK